MNHVDHLMVDCPSFEEFRKRTSALPLTKDRGDAFERLTQAYLQTAPEYRIALEKVWLLREARERSRGDRPGVNHPLVFARSISASKAFRDQQDMFNDLNIGPRADNFHVDSTMSAEDRKKRLDAFIEKPRSVMSNAHCLTEGVNIPGIDAV